MRRRLLRNAAEGQGFVEFAMIILFIALVVIAILGLFGNSIADTYQTIMNNLPF